MARKYGYRRDRRSKPGAVPDRYDGCVSVPPTPYYIYLDPVYGKDMFKVLHHFPYLPIELRLEIYEHALPEPYILHINYDVTIEEVARHPYQDTSDWFSTWMFGNGNKSLSLAHVCREARAEVFFHGYRYIPVDGNIDGAERRWFSFSRDLMYWNTNAFLEDYFDDVTHCLPVCKKYRDQIQDLAIDDWLWYKWVMEEETREERYPRRRGETVKHWTHVLCRDLPSLKVVHLVVNDGQIDPYNGAKLELTRREKVLPFLLGYDWGLVRRQFGRAGLKARLEEAGVAEADIPTGAMLGCLYGILESERF